MAGHEEFRAISDGQRALLEASPAPTLLLDRCLRIRYVSPAAAAYGGVDAESQIGKHVWECYPELEDSDFQRTYESVLDSGRAERFERYLEAGDLWQSVLAYPADGGVLAVLEDITERRRAERALRASEAALARAQEVALIGSFSSTFNRSATGDLLPDTQLSDQAYRLLGFDISRGRPPVEMVRALVRAEDVQAIRSVIAHTPDGADAVTDITLKRLDGAEVILQIRARVVRGADGRPQHFYGTAQDVTAQREAVEHMQRSEQMLRLAQQAANIGSFQRDLHTGRVMWSEQLMRIVGLDPTRLVRGWSENVPRVNYVHPDDRPQVRAVMQRARETRRTEITRNRIIRHDGEVRHLEGHVMFMHDPNGVATRLVGTVVDVTERALAETERQRVETQLQQAHRLESLGVLAGGIAHDFNNLLVGILGNASLALLDLDDAPEARESIQAIEHSAQRAAELTRQLLAYAGKGRYVVEEIDATTAINDMVSLIRAAVARNASLQLDLETSLPHVNADLHQFRQVLLNLVTNASDALAGASGLVSIRTGEQQVTEQYLESCMPGTDGRAGNYVYIEVRDSGIGMDEETRRRIFEPFFSTKFTGRGLGLAATIGMVRSHHGSIHVSSERGTGTVIRVLYPARPRTAVAPARPVNAAPLSS